LHTTVITESASARETLAAHMEKVAQRMKQADDDNHATKMLQVAEKLRRGEWNLAFCGHFSAGKSTMINTLLGADLLPSNPIPTSANVVKIRGGEQIARVHTKNSGVLTFHPDTEMDKLKQYAVDGDTVEWVEIGYPGTFLDEKSSLLDTPGIDSTDAAHKIATESALHLADVVVYMMDYNHVQADENFHFTKTLKDRGKPVYLVINMIDKHIDFELDFDSYKESVEEAFATWNIKPDGIFYTSLAEPDHPENQYEDFRSKLLALIEERESLITESARRAAEHLIEEHVRGLALRNAEERRQLESRLEESRAEDPGALKEALRQAEAELAETEERVQLAVKRMEKELSGLLENARLTYYSTNEAAERYLESRKPGFKVGFLFAGKKTEEERARRVDVLLSDFREKVAGNLDFHFKELLTKLPQEYGIRDEAYHASVHAASVEVTEELLVSCVKAGAGGREYVKNYCADVSNAIKAEYRRLGLRLIEQAARRLEQETNEEREALLARIAQLRKQADTHAALERLAESERAVGEQLRAILHEGV